MASSDTGILVQRDATVPSEGQAVDHIGWRAKDLNAKVAELKGKGVTVTSEPRPLPLPNKTTIFFSYVAGPAGPRSSSSKDNRNLVIGFR